MITIDLVNQTNQRLIENIQRCLDDLDWKIPKLAKVTGLSASGLYDVMSGKSWPGPDNLERIAKALKVSPGALLGNPSGVDEAAESRRKEFEERLRLLNLIGDLDQGQVSHFLSLIEIELGIDGSPNEDCPAPRPKKPQNG